MGKKIKKKIVDQELLHAIFQLENDRKQIRSIIEHSIDPTESVLKQEALLKAKYLFLLREARHRKVSAIRK